LVPGLFGLAVVQVVFVLVKLGEYSRRLVSRDTFWDNYVLFGGLPVRIPNEPFTFGDYLNSSLLFSAGVAALLVWGCLSAFPPPGSKAPPRQRLFWAVLGLGFIYLALDEMLMFHEFIGANLHFDDGHIILGYLGLMGLTALAFRRKFFGHSVAAACLVAGACFQGLGAVADRFHFWEEAFTPEEIAEMTASGLYLLAILQYAHSDVRNLIERRTDMT
jgi:hypothetical protein